ncbi:MAG: IclR family transcriptional regulator [Microbacteriaceae bacterium]
MPDKPKVPAADQTLAILGYLARQRASVPAASIATALGIPRSTTYHLLATLAEHGFVVSGDRRWALGVAAHDLGTGYLRQQPLTLVGRPLVSKLVDAVGENGHLAVLNGRDVVYMVEERAPGRSSLVTDVGVRLPAHLTASGRSMLATMSREQLLALYPDDSAFASRGAVTMTRRQLREELRATRARGYATEHGDVTPGFGSIAVAIVDRVGWPIAALALTFDEQTPVTGSLVSTIKSTAADISKRLRV